MYFSEEGRVLYNSDWAKNWFTDQLIITWALLSTKVCSVPASSNLWEMPGIQFDPTHDDSSKCFHGFGYEDCNRGTPPTHRVGHMGCKWWHFYPFETIENHLEKFYQITNNTVTIDPLILAHINVSDG